MNKRTKEWIEDGAPVFRHDCPVTGGPVMFNPLAWEDEQEITCEHCHKVVASRE